MIKLTLAIGMTIVLNAAMYSASLIGGLRPPDHAILTLNPLPSSVPHCKKTHGQSNRTINKVMINLLLWDHQYQGKSCHHRDDEWTYREL
jgi:hypothetical protein